MFDFFKKKEAKLIDYSQACLVEIDLSTYDGDYDKRLLTLHSLEDNISKSLTMPDGLDGDDISENIATIYLYGSSAEKVFSAVEGVLKQSDYRSITVTLQFGRPDDPNTTEKVFSL